MAITSAPSTTTTSSICSHQHLHAAHGPSPRRPHSKSADWLLGLLAMLCPPAVAHIKTGKQDLWLNLFLTLFGWAPGIFHAWYIMLQHPGCHRCDLAGGHLLHHHNHHYESAPLAGQVHVHGPIPTATATSTPVSVHSPSPAPVREYEHVHSPSIVNGNGHGNGKPGKRDPELPTYTV